VRPSVGSPQSTVRLATSRPAGSRPPSDRAQPYGVVHVDVEDLATRVVQIRRHVRRREHRPVRADGAAAEADGDFRPNTGWQPDWRAGRPPGSPANDALTALARSPARPDRTRSARGHSAPSRPGAPSAPGAPGLPSAPSHTVICGLPSTSKTEPPSGIRWSGLALRKTRVDTPPRHPPTRPRSPARAISSRLTTFPQALSASLGPVT
jgi:hypothetical protein